MDEINEIRELLNKIEASQNDNQIEGFNNTFDLFELPELISSIVDYLQPLLHPYEAAIYWYMFRHAVIKNNDIHIRLSTRGLGQANELIQSASGKSDSLSYASVQKALIGLEEKKVITKEGDTNREGTLYKIFLPEEIPSCQTLMKEKQIKDLPKVDPKKEADFYNIKNNRLKIFERDEYKCHYCKKQLTRFNATLDHIQPVSQGGDNSYENLITACLHCNSERGAKPVMDAIIKGEKKNN